MSDRNDLQQGRERHPHVRHAFLAATASVSSLVLVVSALSMATYFWAREKIDVIPIDARSPGSTLAPDILDDPCTTRPCNYLLLGSDSRAELPPEEYGVDEQVGVYRSDTIIVVRTDPREGRAVILHFPRDLWVEIPGRGPGKINTAFGDGVEGGGPQLVARTIRDLTGLQINHVLYVDLEGFRGVIDAIGGIPMCVDRPLYDQLAGLDIPKAAATRSTAGRRWRTCEPATSPATASPTSPGSPDSSSSFGRCWPRSSRPVSWSICPRPWRRWSRTSGSTPGCATSRSSSTFPSN